MSDSVENRYDLLVIGAGIAGMSAVISAKERGMRVMMVSKTSPARAQSVMAQGGINAALGNVSEDSVRMHIEDTLKSSHGLANPEMVERMCSLAPSVIEKLERLGVPFSRIDGAETPLGSIAQRRLGGARVARACYAQDYTGLKIAHTLYDTVLHMGIERMDDLFLLSLVSEDAVVGGAVFLRISTGEVISIEADKVLLATGGFGAAYHGYTTNACGTTGDAASAVLRAGGRLSGMEFVQFHPTALKGSSILISESARGEGGILVDESGERFTDELAPRDEVSRAIFSKIKSGSDVYLDLTGLGREKLEKLMPQELHLASLHAGVDLATQRVAVSPAVHYTMGGIEVDENYAVTGLKNCFAVGECTNSHLHGANRLGGNSLLEISAFGFDVVEKMERMEVSDSVVDISLSRDRVREEIESMLAGEGESCDIYALRREFGEILFTDVGIIRDRDGLVSALKRCSEIENIVSECSPPDRSRCHNGSLVHLLESRNAILCARATILGAIYREESRGAHYRSDFPDENGMFEEDIVIGMGESGIFVDRGMGVSS
jgi:succinate dehydrogenase / fumarate reductase flavoprotein subunit